MAHYSWFVGIGFAIAYGVAAALAVEIFLSRRGD